MEKDKFNKKLKEKYPDEHYSVVYYGENSSQNSVIKCLDCGRRIEVNTGELFRARRKHICTKCHYKRKDTQKNENVIKEKLEKTKCYDIEFYMEESNGIKHHMVHYKCGKCNRLNTKKVSNLLRQKYNCGYCEGSKELKDTDTFTTQMHDKFGDSFSLMTEYNNACTPIKVKCNKCGFIRDVKPNAFLTSGYCPKCGDKSSRGEKAIASFLEKQNIEFETQKYFKDWNIGIHYFDFYIPKFNLVLEYHGQQHYDFIDYFHKNLADFNYRKKKDIQKLEGAITHGLNYISISYRLYNDLPSILKHIFNSTTIPEGSRGKCLEIETIQDIG